LTKILAFNGIFFGAKDQRNKLWWGQLLTLLCYYVTNWKL